MTNERATPSADEREESTPTLAQAMTDERIARLMQLVDEHGRARWDEGCAASAFDKLGVRRFSETAGELLAEIESAARALASVPPEGYVMVPVEPTAEMAEAALVAAQQAQLDDGQPPPLPKSYELWSSMLVYRAMLAAAPRGTAGEMPAHSKSEYKRRVAMGDTNVAPPNGSGTGRVGDGVPERLPAADQQGNEGGA